MNAIGNVQLKLYRHQMSELGTLSLFLLAVAAVIASFTSVERRITSAIKATKDLCAETSFFKKTLNTT